MAKTFCDNLFKGKNAYVTGGGSGIGFGIADMLAELGASVVICGRKQDRLDAAVAELKKRGGEAYGFSADVRDYDQLSESIAKGKEAVGGNYDIVICGAAGNFPAPAVGMSANAFKSVVDIDLLGTFNTCRAIFEHLNQPGASIVSISAPQAFMPTPFQSHVCAAKAGVDQLMKTMAMEVGGAGVRVNCICPGPVNETEGMERLAPTEAGRQKLIESVPLGKYSEKRDIAEAVTFLCSPAASMITGIVLVVDGGSSLPGSGVWIEAAMKS